MAQTILGVDLGRHSVKAVLLESAYRGFTVTGHAAAPVPPQSQGGPSLRERQGTALKGLLAARAWRFDVAVAVTPGSVVAAHVLTLPFTDQRRIEQTIPFEVEGQIPFELSEAAWDWQHLAPRAGFSDLWVGVAPRSELTDLLAALGGAGVDPRAVVPAAPALAALLAAGVLGEPAHPGAAPGVQAVLDLGEERSLLCLSAGGTLEAARGVSLGAGTLSRALARDLGISEAQAETLLLAEAGGPPPLDASIAPLATDPRAAESLRRALAPLVRELRSTVRAWRARVGPRPLERLWLSGGLARLPGLPEVFAAEVDGPVAPVSLAGAGAAGMPPEEAPRMALALSAALRGHLGGRAGRLNLRRGDAAYTRDFEHLKGKLAALGAAAGLVLLLAVGSASVRVFALSRQEQAVDRALCDAQQHILTKCYDNYEEALSVLRGRGIPGATIPRTSAVDMLSELSLRTPEGVSLRYERIDVTDRKLHLQGTTDTAENVDRIVAGLHGSRCFGDARPQGVRKRSGDSKFEFSVDSTLGCLDGVSGKE
jgi:general secretion pathway protein L